MKLSEYLLSNNLNEIELKAVILEISLRLEYIERVRDNKSVNLAIETLCSCPSRGIRERKRHLPVCPQRIGLGEKDV